MKLPENSLQFALWVLFSCLIMCVMVTRSFLCAAPCQSDSECGLTESCERGQCTNLCDQDQACGLNSICRMENHQKVCSCPPGFTGTPGVECYRIPTACQRNNDCPSGFICKSGVCTAACTGDNACAQNEKCISGSCMCKLIL